MRKHLAILGVVGLLAACDGSNPGTVSKPSAAISATGRAVVSINTGSSRAAQATFSDINRLEVSLTSGGLEAPVVKTFDRSQLASGNPSATFDQVPVGTASIKVTALDNTSIAIGSATASTQILEAQTSNVSMTVKLAPTYAATNATGSVSAQVSIVDGDVITFVPQVSGSYDPLIDTIASITPTTTTGYGASDPNKVGVAITFTSYNNNLGTVFWKNSTASVEYKAYNATWNNIKGTLLCSGTTTITDGNKFSSSRIIELPNTVDYFMMELKVRLPNGKVFYGNDTTSRSL